MHALVSRHGLHPGFACMDDTREGPTSLAVDLIQAFRASLVEGLAVTLFNQRKLKAAMFAPGADGRLVASPAAIRAMILGYESRLLDERKTTLRAVMEAQVVAYKRHCRGEALFEGYEREV